MTGFEMELTQKYVKDYARSTKKDKARILDEYCRLTGADRNTAVQRLRRHRRRPMPRTLPSQPDPGGRPRKWQQPHRLLIAKVWHLADEICGERLYEELGAYLDALEAAGELADFDPLVVAQVRSISLGSLKPMVGDLMVPRSSGGSGKRRVDATLARVPVQPRFGQFAHLAGYVGLDYVEHSGGNSAGRFAVTGTYTELSSGWTARAAGRGKNLAAVEAIHAAAMGRLPMHVRHAHADNAPASLRCLLERIGDGRLHCGVSRSRPYHKNDNAHVEQKNGDKVRKLIGYRRLDTPEAVELLNRLYAVEDLISNFFIPSAKLAGKEYDGKGRLKKKRYDRAQTPYRRLLNNRRINNKTKRRLVSQHRQLDLVDLRRESNRLRRELDQHFR